MLKLHLPHITKHYDYLANNSHHDVNRAKLDTFDKMTSHQYQYEN